MKTTLKEVLKQLYTISGDMYCEISEDGVCTVLHTGSVIPTKDMMYQALPHGGPGLFKVTKANCGSDDCDIGKPAPKCIDVCYSPQKCAVWGFQRVKTEGTMFISLDNIMELVNNAYTEGWEDGFIGE